MPRINNWNEYRINEAAGDSKEPLLNVFFDALNEVVEELNLDMSYSHRAADRSKGNTYDPEADFKSMLAAFAKHGWTRDALNNLFSKFGKDVIEEYGNGGGRKIAGSAGADIFLYYMTKDLKPSHEDLVLAGYEYKDSIEGSVSDYWIKFDYGYQHTKYGQLVLDQQFGSVDKWYSFGYDLIFKTVFEESDIYHGREDNLRKSEWDTKEIKDAFKSGMTFDSGHVANIDLSACAKVIGDQEEFDNFKERLISIFDDMGFKFEGVSDVKHFGTGTVDGNVIELNFAK